MVPVVRYAALAENKRRACLPLPLPLSSRAGFDPSKSKASSDKLAAWIAETPLPDELTRIPGVGPATVAALATVGVDSCAQLVGHFLMFKRTGISMRELCDCACAS